MTTPTAHTHHSCDTFDVSAALGQRLVDLGWTCGTAESCTAGGIASAITDIAGSSAWFSGGAVVYSNALKSALLGVSEHTLQARGAVSEPVVCEMALGALKRLGVDCAVAVSGIAGPGGGSPDKPVGTVCFAWAFANAGIFAGESLGLSHQLSESMGVHGVGDLGFHEVWFHTRRFEGDRTQVRALTVEHALRVMLNGLSTITV